MRITLFSASRSARLLDPVLAPTGRADVAIDKLASLRRLEQRAIAAVLVALGRILIGGRRWRHLGGGLPNRRKQSRRADYKSNTSRQSDTSGERNRSDA